MKLLGSICSSSFLMCLAPLQLTTVAPGTRARSALRHNFFALRKRTASGFGPTTKFKGYAFRKFSEKLAVPRKSTAPSLGATSFAF
jgi:hypothetical protein